MTFWEEVLAIFLGDIFASVLVVLLYAMIQWFLRATDVTVGYAWNWEAKIFTQVSMYEVVAGPRATC